MSITIANGRVSCITMDQWRIYEGGGDPGVLDPPEPKILLI